MNKLWRRLLFLIRREQVRSRTGRRDAASSRDENRGGRGFRMMLATPHSANLGTRCCCARAAARCGAGDRSTGSHEKLRYGLRMLAKNPSFTLIAVLTLAAGIGVNTAVFTAFNAVALRPLDVPQDPDRVFQVDRSTQAGFFSYPDYAYLRDNNSTFSGLVAASFFAFSMSGTTALASEHAGRASQRGGIQFSATSLRQQSGSSGRHARVGKLPQTAGVEPVLGRGFHSRRG